MGAYQVRLLQCCVAQSRLHQNSSAQIASAMSPVLPSRNGQVPVPRGKAGHPPTSLDRKCSKDKYTRMHAEHILPQVHILSHPRLHPPPRAPRASQAMHSSHLRGSLACPVVHMHQP